jgi:hypothetical protein
VARATGVIGDSKVKESGLPNRERSSTVDPLDPAEIDAI